MGSYLRRLSYRLGISPVHLATLTGLHNSDRQRNRMGRHALMELDTGTTTAFVQATRLNREEVTSLTLSAWKYRYPPILRSLPGPRQPLRPDSWFLVAPRFCPQCLAGDSAKDRILCGGSWKKEWHLPIIFSCTEHHIFLRDSCPRCNEPAQDSAILMPRPNDHTLRPAQCRWTVESPGVQKRMSRACGYPLDKPATARPELEPTDSHLSLQRKIIEALTLTTSHDDAAAFFTHLRLAVAALSASWPGSSDLIEPDYRDRVDLYMSGQTDYRRTGRGGTRRYQIIDALPRDAAASAALLSAAHSLLDVEDLRESLTPIIREGFKDKAGRASWNGLVSRNEKTCSQEFRVTIEPLTRSFRMTRDIANVRSATRNDYQPEQIPAFLENDWFTRHLPHVPETSPKLLRRTAAVRLVQWVLGGSMGDSAAYLGIPSHGAKFHTGVAVSRVDPLEFHMALEGIADEISSMSSPVDYRRRRGALRGWALDQVAWEDIIKQLTPTPASWHPPAFDDRKRQVASVFVWAQVTQGEHVFAPRPIEAAQTPDVQRKWGLTRNTTWCHLTRPDAAPHYADLRKVLAKYAIQLAQSIDTGQLPARQ
ncbi:TniQ family protein [Streptomyces sp. SID8499]|nr:TniQ family protein [Streptomyces sp. SID8499]